jgi:hypothetical protein
MFEKVGTEKQIEQTDMEFKYFLTKTCCKPLKKEIWDEDTGFEI